MADLTPRLIKVRDTQRSKSARARKKLTDARRSDN